MSKFRAYRIDQTDAGIVANFTDLSLDDLTPGEVVIDVSHSTINYKDALAATGAGRILRSFPLVGGIDLAGTVVSSESDEFSAGDTVLVNGCGLSETRDGGYSEVARVAADSVVPVPEGMTAKEAMQIGTAGYTADCGDGCNRRRWQYRAGYARCSWLRSGRLDRQSRTS